MPETAEKTYEIFKKTREGRGLSLSEVANALHLTVTMIEQIEAGEFTHKHLAPVFMRGYIRSYAKYLNLPDAIADEMISPLSIANPVKASVKTQPSYVKQTTDGHHSSGHTSLHSKKVLAYLLVVAFLIIIASFWHSMNKPETPVETLSPPPIEQPNPPTFNSEEAESIPNNETPPMIENENNTLSSTNETPPVAPEEENTSEPASPEVVVPPPAPVAPPSPPVVKKQAVSPPPLTQTPNQPEIVDAQEAP